MHVMQESVLALQDSIQLSGILWFQLSNAVGVQRRVYQQGEKRPELEAPWRNGEWSQVLNDRDNVRWVLENGEGRPGEGCCVGQVTKVEKQPGK